MSSQTKQTKKEILFLPSGSIGDSLMMVALCAEIHHLQPETRFTIIARRNALLIRDLAAAYPYIQTIVIKKSIGGILTLVWQSLRKPYVVFMPSAFGKSVFLNTKNFFYLLSLRPGTLTVGLVKNEEGDPYQKSLVYDLHTPHYDNMRQMARLSGLEVLPDGALIEFTFKKPDYFTPPFPQGSYIVFHAYGSSSWKTFPPRRCKELLRLLAEKYPDLSFVVTGGKENTEQARHMIEGIPRATVALDLPILEVAELIRQAALYIGVDTGPTHVAGILRAKSVILSHNLSLSWRPTYNPNAVILKNSTRCLCDDRKGGNCVAIEDGVPYLRCLYDIENSTILEQVDKQLN